jgi:hypothetical protein
MNRAVLNDDNTVDLYVDAGSTLRLAMDATDSDGAVVDIAAWTFRAMIKEEYGGTAVVAYTTPDFDLTTVGRVTWVILDSTTTGLLRSSYVYDVEGVSETGEVTRLSGGRMYMSPEATT